MIYYIGSYGKHYKLLPINFKRPRKHNQHKVNYSKLYKKDDGIIESNLITMLDNSIETLNKYFYYLICILYGKMSKNII